MPIVFSLQHGFRVNYCIQLLFPWYDFLLRTLATQSPLTSSLLACRTQRPKTKHGVLTFIDSERLGPDLETLRHPYRMLSCEVCDWCLLQRHALLRPKDTHESHHVAQLLEGGAVWMFGCRNAQSIGMLEVHQWVKSWPWREMSC